MSNSTGFENGEKTSLKGNASNCSMVTKVYDEPTRNNESISFQETGKLEPALSDYGT